MAFSAITSAEITTGEPTSTLTGTKIKDNFDNHESRIASLETSIGAYRPIEFYVKGYYYRAGAQNYVLFDRINFDLTLSAARLILLDTGTSGNLEVDVLYKRGAGAFASIFSTKPILGFASAQFATNTGTLSTTALLSGDILALSLTQVMVDNTEFLLQLDFGV